MNFADGGGEAANSLGRYAYRAHYLSTSGLLFQLQIMCECVQLLSSSLSDTGLSEGNFSEETQVTGNFADVRSVRGGSSRLQATLEAQSLVSIFPLLSVCSTVY